MPYTHFVYLWRGAPSVMEALAKRPSRGVTMRSAIQIIFILILTLALPLRSHAAPPETAEKASTRTPILEELSRFLIGIWSEIGCHIDPDGRCREAPSQQTDIGCHIDPNGGCRE